MASQSETGHAKNVALFHEMIAVCTSYGASYNPAKASIKLAALNALHADAVGALANVNAQLAAHTNAVNAREEAFAPLKALVTRVVNAAIASDMGKSIQADIKTIARKLQGRRAAPKKEADEAGGTKTISVSQMSFDQRIENWDKLVQLLASQPQYVPNEPELSQAGLGATLSALRASNAAAIGTQTALSNARIVRNNLLYAEGTGLVDCSVNVKSYVKSLYGASSPQYKLLSGLKINKLKH